MLSFSPVTIRDRETIQAFFKKSPFRNCDFSFANIFSWQHYYDTTFAVADNGFLYIRFQTARHPPGYLFPLGDGNLQTALEDLMHDVALQNDAFRLHAITREMFDQINAAFPNRFTLRMERDWSEYIYSSTDLIHLVGKKFQPKRNHINKFRRTYQWEYLPITPDIIPDCLDLYERWCIENGGRHSPQALVEERFATQKVFANFEHLGLIGGALRVNGKIRAYSYGQPLTTDTFGVHAEKSLYEIDGGFAMINQQFAEHNCADYRYINREEDLGLDSLRQAKLSYHPVILLEKGIVKEK
jgi:hypothetical protein